jgi:pimeloyl-ACP methyl ester carboxylesterase/DNA-binding CsgD family transcriptional regulator
VVRVADQRIGFARASDGVRIAYAVCGRGPVLVMPPYWFSHLELEWDSPARRHWITALSASNTLIRYDLRGTGLSDRRVAAQSLDVWLNDLAAVLDAARVERCALLGVCQAGPIAVAFAASQPDRVSALALYGTYARCGPLGTRSPAEAGVVDTLIRHHPDLSGALREVVARLVLPDAAADVVAAFVTLQQASAAPGDTARINAAHAAVDVTAHAARITAPTLVLHLREDVFVPFEQGRILAALIPRSRFVPLPGRNHVLSAGDPAWSRLLAEVSQFLGGSPQPAGDEESLTNRQREIIALVARGHGNDEIAARLHISARTVERHLSNIYAKLGVTGRSARAAAAAVAAQHHRSIER